MILDYASGTPEQMTTSLMESVQRALGDSDRRLASIEDDLGQTTEWNHIETGFVAMGGLPTGTYKDADVVFKTTFETPPDVVVCLNAKVSDARYGSCAVSVNHITTEGFSARAYNNASGGNWGVSFRWIAVEKTTGPKMIRGPQGPAGPAGRDGKDGGGSGGTSDYTELTNKPQINGTTLTGDKASSALGLADAVHTHVKADVTDFPEDVSAFNNDAGYLTTETDPTVPAWAKASTKPSYTAAEVGAQETLVSGTNIKTINNQSLLGSGNISVGGGSGGTSDYDQLSNRPAINSNTLTGDQSSADLGLADASHSHVTSDITNFPTNVSAFANDASYLSGNWEVLYDDSSGWTPSTSSGTTVSGAISTYSQVEVHLSDGSFGICNLSWNSDGTGVILGTLTYPYNEYIYANSINFKLTPNGSNYSLIVPSTAQMPANYRIGTSIIKVSTVRKLKKIVGLVSTKA